jgi:hypothetical protein
VKVRTQISGRYWPTAEPIFLLRRRLISAGIDVAFPEHDSYQSERAGIRYTFDIGARSLKATENLLFLAIERSSFHTLVNSVMGAPYVGVSSSVEVAYAILNMKPVIVTERECRFSESVPPFITDLIRANWEKFPCLPLFDIEIDILAPTIQVSLEDAGATYLLPSPPVQKDLKDHFQTYLGSLDDTTGHTQT